MDTTEFRGTSGAAATEPGQSAPAEPRYRTTLLFVATMLAGFIIGWVAILALVLRHY